MVLLELEVFVKRREFLLDSWVSISSRYDISC